MLIDRARRRRPRAARHPLGRPRLLVRRRPEVMWPDAGRDRRPLNTRIWVAQLALELTALGEPLLQVFGETTALDLHDLDDRHQQRPLTVLTPLAPLAPMTRYELLDCAYARPSTHRRQPRHPLHHRPPCRHRSPARPVETDRSGDAGGSGRNSCGKYKSGPPSSRRRGPARRRRSTSGTFDPADPAPATTSGRHPRRRRSSSAAAPASPAGPPARDSAPVRYGAFDLAGNFSGWTEPDTLTIGRGCGCRSDAPGAPSLLLLAVAALALRRRRRQ
jgi:MYXO-CTERM domain-containing protein